MKCGYCGEEITEKVNFCRKCVESYKINDKPIKNNPKPNYDQIRKWKIIQPTQQKIPSPLKPPSNPSSFVSSPFAKMGMRIIGFIVGSMIAIITITAIFGG